MKLLALALGTMLVLLQYPLWLGKGGWLRVWELDRQVVAQKKTNDRLAQRNEALEGEVRDLREGTLAVEERARYELGMVRADETFVQINIRPVPAAPRTDPQDVKPAANPAEPKALAAASIKPSSAPVVLQAAPALGR